MTVAVSLSTLRRGGRARMDEPGYEVAMEWEDGNLTKAEIRCVIDRDCSIMARDMEFTVKDPDGAPLPTRMEEDVLCFAAKCGVAYSIENCTYGSC